MGVRSVFSRTACHGWHVNWVAYQSSHDIGRVASTSPAAGETPCQMTWQGALDSQGWWLGRLLARWPQECTKGGAPFLQSLALLGGACQPVIDLPRIPHPLVGLSASSDIVPLITGSSTCVVGPFLSQALADLTLFFSACPQRLL